MLKRLGTRLRVRVETAVYQRRLSLAELQVMLNDLEASPVPVYERACEQYNIRPLDPS